MNEQERSGLTRRTFLAGALAAAATPLIAPGRGAEAADSLDFASALDAAAAIREKTVSSVELTQAMYARIAKHNGALNAVVTLTEESALARAKEADAALAQGTTWGPFHGVPITIKDTFEMKGVRSTAGAPELSKFIGRRDAVGVTRLKKAGAVILGKTNVPYMAGDMQTYNEVFGQTNNPWDVSVTSGGSTGGGAAALASGMSYLSFGSDIGGSIRTPANFCGVYGHKPTLDLVPETGHIPPPPGITSVSNGLSVVGPLARSAEDLMAALKVLGGPSGEMAVGYRWEMPAPRKRSLSEYKVGYVIDDPFCPVVPETKAILEDALEALRAEGATLVEGWPKGINPQRAFDAYVYLLIAVIDLMAPPTLLERTKELAQQGDPFAKIRTKANHDLSKQFFFAKTGQQMNRDLWQGYFGDVDVFLSPVTFMPAFPHDHSEQATRRLDTSLGDRSYLDLLAWIAHATYSGCPATSMPVGRTERNLPVNLQIMGPFLEDATPIDFAAKLSKVIGGFEAPPGFA